MKRQIVYPGQVPLETDILNTNKNVMIAVARVLQDMLGTATLFSGLACVPTAPAGMTVNVNAGCAYSLQQTDTGAYSSLPADSHQILKQGLTQDATNFACPAPVTAGFSINYLVQAAFQEVDGASVVLPYYNATNPAQAYSGPDDSGQSQATARDNTVQLQLKAGAAATTGTQVTPTPDAGFTGLWVVTVAFGATTISSGSIAQYPSAPLLPTSLLQMIQQAGGIYVGSATGTANAHVIAPTPPITARVDGMVLRYKASAANTTALTLNDGLGAVSVVGGAHAALQGGETVANGDVWVQWNTSIGGGSYVLLDSTGGALQVAPATQPAHALQLAQAQAMQGSYAGASTVANNAVLTSASLGELLIVGGGNTTFLPAASALLSGQGFEFENTSAVQASTIQVNATPGTDVISVGSVSASIFSLPPGQSIKIYRVASGQFRASGLGTANVVPLPVAPAVAANQAAQLGQVSGVVGQTRNLVMSVATASATATMTADEIIVETALGGLRYCLPSFNHTINLATTGAGGMDTGTAPVSGFVGIYAIYNPTSGASALLATNATSAAISNIYGGTLPTGYTASALLAVIGTTAGSLLIASYTQDRRTTVSPATAFYNTNSPSGVAIAVSASTAVPKNAKTISLGFAAGALPGATLSQVVISGTLSGIGSQGFQINSTSATNTDQSSVARDIPLITPQTVVYQFNASGASTATYNMGCIDYTI